MRQLASGFMGSLLLFAFACGGKVVVESTGATGTGGAGGTGDGGSIASTGNVSPVGQVSVAVSTGGPSLCEQVCADQTAKGCNEGQNCVADCQDAYATAGKCTPQLDALVNCLLATSDTTCMTPVQCQGQVQAYTSCMSPQMCSGMTSCSGSGDGTCDCVTDCNGSKLEVQCTPGNATDFCTCFKDGMPIDKCGEPQVTGLSCSIEKGCCASSFFPTDSP